MMKRVLVGTDGSPAATRGVAWAAGLASALSAELVVTAVTSADLGGLGDVTRDGAESSERREDIVGLLESSWSAPARGIDVALSTLLLEGDPRIALLEAAAERNADVLVLGSAGRGWFPALHLGHVAHAVAHHSTVPVVIVPPSSAPDNKGCVMVGVDGSAGSRAAVEWTGALARALHRDVLAVHAHMRERGESSSGQDEELERRCDEWAAPLRTAGVTARVVVIQGWPPSAIVDLEAIEAPGLVVLGARGAGGFQDLRLGSVALQVLQRSVVPVAIVPGEFSVD